MGRIRLVLALLGAFACLTAAQGAEAGARTFPRALEDYPASANPGLGGILAERVRAEPFNLVATLLFVLAIVHTFLAPRFLQLSHRLEEAHRRRLSSRGYVPGVAGQRAKVSFAAELFHFLGEIEAVFGIWVIPLVMAITAFKGWGKAHDYLGHGLNFTEPLFVVVIMTIAASRPILQCVEWVMARVAALGNRSTAAWWLSILTVGPILGSFITEPAAMTIAALLLGQKFYAKGPSSKLAYATLGLLFVDISVGGTLTHFAAPPVLMVAAKWGWGLRHMFDEFGWKAVVGILLANGLVFMGFRGEFQRLAGPGAASTAGDTSAAASDPVPLWIVGIHLLFLAWTVLNNHYPVWFIGGFLFYLAFLQATEHHQSDLALRPAMLVGFFLAGLVVHGGLQGWWIAPVLGGLKELPLFFGALGLTAFNDNAAITYLATFVPDFGPAMKHAVVAGAVVGGGLTVIANAPNPAGQSILAKYFPGGISPLKLLLGALIPTAIIAGTFMLL